MMVTYIFQNRAMWTMKIPMDYFIGGDFKVLLLPPLSDPEAASIKQVMHKVSLCTKSQMTMSVQSCYVHRFLIRKAGFFDFVKRQVLLSASTISWGLVRTVSHLASLWFKIDFILISSSRCKKLWGVWEIPWLYPRTGSESILHRAIR